MEKKLNDISISGSGKVAGGEYGNIRISGSGRITDDVICESLHISGSGRADNIEAIEIKASGSFHAGGSVKANALHVSGSAHIGGAIEGGDIHISGSMHADDIISAKTVHVSGSLHAGSGIEADKAVISGGAKIEGLLNAEEIKIHLGGKCVISEIGGERIQVIKGNNRVNLSFNFLGMFSKKLTFSMLETNSIEGTEVFLENTICPIVRAKRAVIGEGCEIDRIEYEETIEIHEGAVVKEQVKL
ncbi:MAG: hypothetical protein IIW08_08100 [Clostridia bacterium]|nr:hypothetical protein [Clostridia bacterium]